MQLAAYSSKTEIYLDLVQAQAPHVWEIQLQPTGKPTALLFNAQALQRVALIEFDGLDWALGQSE